nr:uncharacterized protein LOC109169177 [Ipomoea batatas]
MEEQCRSGQWSVEVDSRQVAEADQAGRSGPVEEQCWSRLALARGSAAGRNVGALESGRHVPQDEVGGSGGDGAVAIELPVGMHVEASSSSGKAPTTPPLITVPFAPRQTRSTNKRAIAAAREAPPVPEYQQPTDILEVSSDFHGPMKYNAAYVVDEGGQSSPNETSEENLDEEIGDFLSNSQITVENLRTQDLEYTPSLPTDHHAASPVPGVQSVSTQKVNKFVRFVVREFYANLVPQLIRFGQAYVTGRMYAFNPMVINQFFGSFDCDAACTEDIDVVTRRLTGGTRLRWKGYVPRAMAVLLFKITSGIQVNLGQLLFDQVIDARNGAKGRKDLILPNLIYSLLVVQGFEKDASEFYEVEPKLIKADHRLLTGTHIDDLAGPNDNVGPSSAVDTTSVTIAFLENELRLIHDHRQMLSTREARITGLLSTLRQNTHDGDSPDCEVASSSDESVAF